MCYIDLLINHNILQSQAMADEKVEIRMAKKRKTSLNLMQKSWQVLVDLQNVVRYFLKNQSYPKHTGLISSDSFQITTLTACTTLKIQPLWL